MGLIHAEETERIVVMITPTLTLQQNELAEPIGASDCAAFPTLLETRRVGLTFLHLLHLLHRFPLKTKHTDSDYACQRHGDVEDVLQRPIIS
jgi:hypothetical protein